MKRKILNIPVAAEQAESLKEKMLHWASPCNIFLFWDSRSYTHTKPEYDFILACGAARIETDLSTLQFGDGVWRFGHLCYEAKDLFEHLSSEKPARFSFPLVQFFQPETVIYKKVGAADWTIECVHEQPEKVWETICAQPVQQLDPLPQVHFKKRIEHAAYLAIAERLREHIAAGDCYEINFCNEWFAEGVHMQALAAYRQLQAGTSAPFSSFYRVEDDYLIGASPERFIRKTGAIIQAQPMKGTAKRSASPEEDERIKAALRSNIKERAENVMIADLMRNDLARVCVPGSIVADELFGVYSFPTVHQMISSVSGTLREGITPEEIFRAVFPPGSMTGAPKIKTMQLIEQYEEARRTLYSGCLGYISPEGNFDFSVLIRSMQYNARTGYLNYQTGGAITYDSIPEQEWEETVLKAKILSSVFPPQD